MNKRLILLAIMFYCYSLFVGLLFQLSLPHVLPDMVVPGGRLTTDSQYFHEIAVRVANTIHTTGWGTWSPFPNEYTAFNVALLGAIYAIFGVDPKLSVPLNAFFHAGAALMLLAIIYNVSEKSNIGFRLGFIAALLFLIFPSALNWYGQIHKDSFVIFGVFGAVLSFSLLPDQKNNISYPVFFGLLIGLLASLILVAICRPYFLNFFQLFFVFVGLLVVQKCVKNKKIEGSDLMVFSFSFLGFFASKYLSLVAIGMGAGDAQNGMTYASSQKVNFDVLTVEGDAGNTSAFFQEHFGSVYTYLLVFWEKAGYYLGIIAETRHNLIQHSVASGANSLVDGDVVFRRPLDVVLYIPRALVVAIFAPFPSEWLSKFSVIRLVSYVEMSVFYIAFLGLLGLVFDRNKFRKVLPILILILIFMMAFGLTIANVGTLYRVRYAFEFLLAALGIFGWPSVIVAAKNLVGRYK